MHTIEMTAQFVRVRDAVEFVDKYLRHGHSFESNVVREGKTVTWTGNLEDDSPRRRYEYLQDLLENVGYVGSYGGRNAKLNGQPAPVSY